MHTVIDIEFYIINKFLFLSMSRVHTCNEFKILKITKNVSCAIYTRTSGYYILYLFIYYYVYLNVCVCSYGFVLYYIFLFLF